jgi:tRNA (guanosine-2'-O-)-methyltransferase
MLRRRSFRKNSQKLPEVRVHRDGDSVFEPMSVAAPWKADWTVEGVIRTLEPMVSDERKARLSRVVEARVGSVTVVLDSPRDPHNGAAVLRTCDALGIQRLYVVPGEDGFVAASNVTTGAERWVDTIRLSTPAHAVQELKRLGFTLLATHPRGELVPSDLASFSRLALVMGNEHQGIRAELADASEARVRVPMNGFVESLNLSVCAAILLVAATRGRAGDLDAGERKRLYARWLFQSVARAGEVLSALPPL